MLSWPLSNQSFHTKESSRHAQRYKVAEQRHVLRRPCYHELSPISDVGIESSRRSMAQRCRPSLRCSSSSASLPPMLKRLSALLLPVRHLLLDNCLSHPHHRGVSASLKAVTLDLVKNILIDVLVDGTPHDLGHEAADDTSVLCCA